MAELELKEVSKSFGSVEVVRHVNLSVDDGEFVVFVGPSGCGKSTLLRMIAGLEKVGGGEIRIGARDVTDLDPSERGVAMVFQSYALYPHMSVEENIGFGLRMNGMSKSEVAGQGRRGGVDPPSRGLAEAEAERIVGRPAATGGYRAGDRPQA